MIRLNNLRNRVGHELDYILSESDIDELGYMSYADGKEYIIKKYDFDNLNDLLLDVLTKTVISVSMLVLTLIAQEKIKVKLEKETKK